MAWKPEYIILIIVSTLIDYIAGLQIGKQSEPRKKKIWLYLSVITNLGILFTFKYFNFFSSSVSSIFNQFNIFYNMPTFHLLLPVGISFYTFQSMSYTIDVYNGKVEPERNIGLFAVYVSFFPQLVAGPIERSSHLLPELKKETRISYSNFSIGVKKIIYGYFMKLVVADRLALYVNSVYNHADLHGTLSLITATFFFAFQIYCDFAGYSLIAIGAAKIMDVELMENFRRPYFSMSIREFWSRWHISLSTWFRDYLYIPLGGNRTIKWRWYFNLFITFLVSGLWHGANWTFLIWGIIHGLYLIISIISKNIRNRTTALFRINKHPFFEKTLKIVITFILANFAWIFFRANNIKDALKIVSGIFIYKPGFYLGSKSIFLTSIFSIILLMVFELQKEFKIINKTTYDRSLSRQIIYSVLILLILMLGVFDGGQFIYFQF